MSGDLLVMEGPKVNVNKRIQDLSDLDAFVVTIASIAPYLPQGATFGDLFYGRIRESDLKEPIQGMGVWDIFRPSKWKNAASDMVSWVGDTAGKTGDKIGGWIGSGVRLLTDKDVREGLQDYASAYATGGKSAAFKGLINGNGNPEEQNMLQKFLGMFGSSAKNSAQLASGAEIGISKNAMVIGGAVIGGGLLIALLSNRKR